MPKSEHLNKTARRQLDGAAGPTLDRMGLLNAAKAWLDRNGVGDCHIEDILAVAEYLGGEDQ